MNRSIKHYLNDQCIRLLRNFPYPIRQKIKRFPPVASVAGKSVVAVLCGPKQFLEGLWSLWSWMRHINHPLEAVLFFDGQATHGQKVVFNKLFPKGKLLELAAFLDSRPLPDYLRRFVAGNWTAKKLAAVYELQKEVGVLYSDCDVVTFQTPEEIIKAIGAGHSVYMFDEVGYTLDPWLANRASKIGIPLTKQFNAGLVYVPQGEMKATVLEAILSDWQMSDNSHHAEQTLFSLLLDPQRTRPLSKDAYVLSWQGVWAFEKDLDCRQMVCRHYVGPIRHRMYLTAYPFLLNQMSGRVGAARSDGC